MQLVIGRFGYSFIILGLSFGVIWSILYMRAEKDTNQKHVKKTLIRHYTKLNLARVMPD